MVRATDFERFRGNRVAVKGRGILCGRATRLEGELVGLEVGDSAEDDAASEWIVLRLNGGDEVRVPRSDVKDAHLVYEWKKT